jgi:hypothetical protein
MAPEADEMRSTSTPPAVVAQVGYAADRRGRGIVYARVSGAQAEHLLRVGFRVPLPVCARAVGYAAVRAMIKMLVSRGVGEVTFVLGDAAFVRQVATGCDIDELLAIPYVRLRCALNTLTKYRVRAGATDDLTQRARAEVALNLAA